MKTLGMTIAEREARIQDNWKKFDQMEEYLGPDWVEQGRRESDRIYAKMCEDGTTRYMALEYLGKDGPRELGVSSPSAEAYILRCCPEFVNGAR